MDEWGAILVLVGLAVLAVPVLLVIALISLSGMKQRVNRLEQRLHALEAAGVQSAPDAQAATEAASVKSAPTLAEPIRAEFPEATAPPAPAPRSSAQPAPSPPRFSPAPPPLPQSPQRPELAADPTSSPRPKFPPPLEALQEPVRPDIITIAMRAVKHWFTVGNVPVKIGVLVLFAGVAALLKYASDQGWLRMPIELRLAGIAAASLAGLVFAWRKRESHRSFALSLQGGAIGILLLTVFAAFKREGLMDATPAFLISVILIFGAGALAVLQNAKALAVFALLAGFLAPIWLSTGSGNHVALFSYYAVLNLAVLGVAWWKPWRVLNLLGFVFTFGIGTLWGVLDYAPQKFASTEPFLLLFFAFYLTIPLLYARRMPSSRRGWVEGCLVFGTPLVAFSLQAGLLEGKGLSLAFNALGLAVIYAGLAAWLRRREGFALLSAPYAVLAVGFATLAVPLALSARATSCVFALEGAALVWLGLRQQRRMPQFSGALLQLLAALAFFLSDAPKGDVAVANPMFMSAVLIALAGFATAAVYRRAANSWALPFYLWGLAWWLGCVIHEIGRFIDWNARADALLVLAAATGWIAAEAHRRREWTALAVTTLFALIAAAPIAILQSSAHGQPFGGQGAWAWLVYALLGIRSLICLRRSEHVLAGWAQFAWLLIWPMVLSLLLDWLGRRHALAEGWHLLGIAAPWLGALALSLYRWSWLSTPQGERFDAYRRTLQQVYIVLLGIGWLVALSSSGDPSPLPWLPVLNPLELAQLAFIVLLAVWLSSEGIRLGWGQRRPLMISLLGFGLITASVLRSVHHWGDIAWSDAMLSTSLAQTSLTVAWSVLGVIGWVLGSRRGQRTLWLAGAVLMGVVLLKLLLVDRGNLGDALGIASFIAYGLLCTVVGYFAPVPPRRADPAPAQETSA